MTAATEYEKAKQTPPKAGDTVRVTITGRTGTDWPEKCAVGAWVEILPDDVVTVEVIRPTLINGDVIQAAEHPHMFAVRQGGVWRWTDLINGSGWDDETTERHLASGVYTPLRISGSAAQS